MRLRWIAPLCAFATIAAQGAPLVISTTPNPVQEGRSFDLTISGLMVRNIGPVPEPAYVFDGNALEIQLRRDCGFATCPAPAFDTETVSGLRLPAGTYTVRIFEGSPATLPSPATPDFQSALTVAPACYQGLWWRSPAGSESGWGLFIDQQGDIIFAAWFTYDASGKGMWLVMSRANQTGPRTFEGPIYRTEGPPFNSPQWNGSAVSYATVGSGMLAFTDSANGSFTYTIDGITTTKPITRQVFGASVANCVAGG